MFLGKLDTRVTIVSLRDFFKFGLLRNCKNGFPRNVSRSCRKVFLGNLDTRETIVSLRDIVKFGLLRNVLQDILLGGSRRPGIQITYVTLFLRVAASWIVYFNQAIKLASIMA